MREIWYRGQDKHGKWHYGYYVFTDRGGDKHMIHSEPPTHKSNTFDIHEVIRETVKIKVCGQWFDKKELSDTVKNGLTNDSK